MKSSLIIGAFVKDKDIRGMYNPFKLQYQFPFNFLRVSEIKTEIIKQNGADFVIQSFAKQKPTDKDKIKVLHSGLIRLKEFNDVYYGDNISLKNNRKDFFIVEMQKGILTMYYFKNRNPRNKVKFSKNFLQTINNATNEKN